MKIIKKVILILILAILVGGGAFFATQLKVDNSFELNGDQEMVLALNSTYEELGASKDCQITGSVDTSKEGTYQVQYTYDWKGFFNKDKQTIFTRTIKVVDDSRMIFNLKGSYDTYVKQNDPYIESGCHVIDKEDGNLTGKVEILGQVDTSTVGDYEVVYQVTNSAGYTLKKSRMVHVVSSDSRNWAEDGIPVFMFHEIYDIYNPAENMDGNWLPSQELEKWLTYLKENDYYICSFSELRAYVDGKISLPSKSCILTFDDGNEGFLQQFVPIANQYEVPLVSFVIASWNGEYKMKEYASEYVSYQSHSFNQHRGGGSIGHGGVVSALSYDELLWDIKKSFEVVQNSEAYCYPFGDVTDDVVAAVEDAGALCAFTTVYGRCYPGDDPYQLSRIRIHGSFDLDDFKNLLD